MSVRGPPPPFGGAANAATLSLDKIKNTRLKATSVAVTLDNDNKYLKRGP